MELREGMTVKEIQDRLDGPPITGPENWQDWPATLEAYRRASERLIETIPEYPGGFADRGIVICAGGATYFPCAWVCIQMLRHLGCALPI